MHCIACLIQWVWVGCGEDKFDTTYFFFFFFQAEDGIRDVERSRGLGDVYKRQRKERTAEMLDPLGYLFVNAYYNSPGDGPIIWPIHMGGHQANCSFVDGHVSSGRSQIRGEYGAQAMYKTNGSIFYHYYGLPAESNWHRHDGRNIPGA
eukprot:TRINITY_DN3480_c0_g1_i3.p2 TRINITY_DN3480_c0_g1~~TRINITY_DN3480_c0_g1_i3.p2  ORF type:complete len:149 (+),score=27.24 TRINITY_DN3480_c0_g1_i3:23-469(+)